MKFDLCIGNPPYQDKNQSIYQLFIDEMMRLKIPSIVMITKNNWMTGSTLKGTRDRMIDYGISRIINYPIGTEMFIGVFAAVTIFELDKSIKTDSGYSAKYTEIKNGEITNSMNIVIVPGWTIGTSSDLVNGIINKVLKSDDFDQFDNIKNARLFSIASNGYFMQSNYTEDILKYTKKKEDSSNIPVVFMNKSHKPYIKYTSLSELPKGKEYIDYYKIVCGSKVANNNQVISNMRLLYPGYIITNSWAIIAMSKDETEIRNMCKYIQSKLFRFLIRSTIVGSRVSFGVGNSVYTPTQDFSSNSDINWNSDIRDINNQLYNKYKLDKHEIQLIEGLIDIDYTEIKEGIKL